MDDEMKRRLVRYMSEKKIKSVPFWIKDEKTVSKKEARKKLGISQDKFVLLYFGFVTWYKGADWIIKTVGDKNFLRKHPKVHLVMAGGEAHSLKDKTYYQKYYSEQKLNVRNSKNITLTGFVKDEDVSAYFAAADAVVFPYRGLIGSSGAVTHAITHEKPFVLSSKMKGGLNNPVYQNAIRNSGLVTDELTFQHNLASFDDAVKFMEEKENLEKLTKVSRYIKANRSFEVQLPIYWNSIFGADAQPLVRLEEVLVNAAYQPANQ
jgi:glycosyltransferase involved in cell wall biosynthesis